MNYQEVAKQVIREELLAVESLLGRVDSRFDRAVEFILQRKGRVVLSGIGKAGIIAHKIASSLASLGTPSFFMHPSEAAHGDLGMITSEDVVILISNSGSSIEVLDIVPFIKMIGAPIIAITGNEDSPLAKKSDVALVLGILKEACGMNLAPTCSTTALLVMGDALAIAVMKGYGNFDERSFAFFHPGGALGKRLMLVKDLMNDDPVVVEKGASIEETIIAITYKKAGLAMIVDEDRKLLGVFSDGDLRRALTKKVPLHTPVLEMSTKKPATTTGETFVIEALGSLKERKISDIPVLNSKGEVIGVLSLKDLLAVGLF